MRNLLCSLAFVAFAASPVVAQTAPTEPAPQAKPKMIKKVVCERVEAEQETGSRLGATTKLCKTIEVPAPEDNRNQSSNKSITAPQG